MATELPLSVWPTAQHTGRAQRSRRYLDISGVHLAKMLPAIASRAIATYTQPGDITLDPMCGVGTTLVEAVHQGRDAIGIEYEPQWADLAHANLALANSQGAAAPGEVICGAGRCLAGLIDPAVRGLVTLVLTSPPNGPSQHGRVTAVPGGGVRKRPVLDRPGQPGPRRPGRAARRHADPAVRRRSGPAPRRGRGHDGAPLVAQRPAHRPSPALS